MTTPATHRPVAPAAAAPHLTDPDQGHRARRTATWAGLLWLAAGVGAFTPATPGAGAGADEIRAYVGENLATLSVNAVSSVVGMVALLSLVAALSTLIEVHRPGSVAARFVLGAGALAGVQMAFFSAVYSVWLFADPAELGDASLTALYAAGTIADALGSLVLFVTCAMVGVVSWLALKHRFLSRPVAVLGLLVAAGQALSIARVLGLEGGFTVAMYVGVFGWFLWPAVVAVDLGIRVLRARR